MCGSLVVEQAVNLDNAKGREIKLLRVEKAYLQFVHLNFKLDWNLLGSKISSNETVTKNPFRIISTQSKLRL